MSTTTMFRYIRPTMPRGGLLQISGITKILSAALRAKTFEELKIPLFVSATDLNRGRSVYFSEGELLNCIIASSSIPILFNPVVINNIYYVDGGVLDNMPIKPIEGNCRLIIGSFVNPIGVEDNISGLVQIAERTFMVSMSKEIAEKAKKFDLFIAPPELNKYKILDSEKAQEIFENRIQGNEEKLGDSGIRKNIENKLSE